MSTKNDLLSLQQFFYDIDYELLKKQKLCLLEALSKTISQGEFDNLNGLMHLIDSIQDYAADVVGISSVFKEE